MSLGDFAVSDDTKLLAYSTDETGFRQYTMVIKELRTGALMNWRRERVTSAAWTTDGRDLFYTVEDDTTKRFASTWRQLSPASAVPTSWYTRKATRRSRSMYRGREAAPGWRSQSGSHTTSESRVLPAIWAMASGSPALWVTDVEYDVEHHPERRSAEASSSASTTPAGTFGWYALLPGRLHVTRCRRCCRIASM